ncbi:MULTISPECIES: DUF1501 domain-containing protein [Pirellulaceae]|uniref:Uncharacterized protein (DUF1501 family) n=1 Tax=Aporhodopirellula rubra TaxID=980271 RepID=A0A7W5E5N7_9BACT|nr:MULTISPECIES: DUF1501 domain-containing protein [Pirellulaceae]EMI43715.1 protein containing DUF1501 [Rhodopirellula sp. SWK7]MBB3210665.1 uncharacterized protein (DUF1501 family) [Aporhodopirellula rubra]
MQFSNNEDLSRRAFVQSIAKSCLGVSLLGGLESVASAASASGSSKSNKRMIYLFMQGAMSQLDTFDPKPDSKMQGPTGVIQTKIPGVQFSEHLPKLAASADKLAVIRSMNSSTGAHGPGQYLMRTNYREIASTVHPGWGSWMHKVHGRMHQSLPASVQVGGGQGPGYLGTAYAPVPVGDPNKGLENTKSPDYMTNSLFDRRMKLAGTFDRSFRSRTSGNREVSGYDELYRDAIGLLRSKDLAAFDVMAESEQVREKYGNSKLGRGCLLARRLIEHGVRFVEVGYGSWDHHSDLVQNMTERGAALDQALSALLEDLEQRGLLEDTLVVVGTEFGRKPKMNERAGRDHHPAAYSCVLAGGGIQAGQVYGETDDDAFYADMDPVSVEDFNATIGTVLDLPIRKEFYSPSGRPFTIAHDGDPIKEII